MQVEDTTGKTIKILVNTFGNEAEDLAEVIETDQKSIYYMDTKGRRCRFLRTQAGMLFRYEEPDAEETEALLQEPAKTPAEPDEALKEEADEPKRKASLKQK